MGLSENSVPLHPMVNISVSLLNGYNWGYAPFSDIPIYSRCMSRRRLYELRYRLRIDIWKTSNLGRLVSLFSHLRNEKLPSDNVCVCQFSSLSSVPMSSWFLISPLYQLPIWSPHYIGCPATSPSQVYPHPSVGAFNGKPHPGAIGLDRAQHGRLGPLRSRH